MLSELRKLFSSVSILICLAVTIAFLAVFIFQAYRSRYTDTEEYKKFLSEILEEDDVYSYLSSKKKMLESNLMEMGDDELFGQPGDYAENLMGDYLLYVKASGKADYVYTQLPQDRINIVKDSLYHIADENKKDVPDYGTIRQNERIIALYNRIVPCSLSNSGSLEQTMLFFDNTLWDYVFIALIVILTVRMFMMDISCGAFRLIYTSINGRRILFRRQLSAVVAVGVVFIAVQSICQFLCGYFFFDTCDMTLPLQIFPEFEFCPYQISLGEFFAIKFLGKCLFYVSLITSIAWITIISRKVTLCLVSGLMIGIVPVIGLTSFFLYSLDRDANAAQLKYRVYDFFRMVTPHALLNPQTYFRSYDEIMLGNLFINRFVMACTISTLIIILSCFAASRCYGKARK